MGSGAMSPEMWRGKRVSIFIVIACIYLICSAFSGALATVPELGSTRVVFQTNYGDIEFGFYPSVAPKTVEHIFKLVRLGCYNTNHFFRVDRGFVAQVADVRWRKKCSYECSAEVGR
ncbi:Peptidyl-prolyl cis-trans isomerase CYP23 [Forsythia ovata]|uniref:Peptidyl-prolyl cis-trans isomerase CYP23 n=1 Tax=Forsythia ovata TaxID=205694 RepID=A0ABD1TBR5_9LAMI